MMAFYFGTLRATVFSLHIGDCIAHLPSYVPIFIVISMHVIRPLSPVYGEGFLTVDTCFDAAVRHSPGSTMPWPVVWDILASPISPRAEEIGGLNY